MFDFNFLAPCPSSGLIIQGSADDLVPVDDVKALVERLRNQRGIAIGYELVDGADHFFQAKLPDLMAKIDAYLDAADVPARMT